MGDDVHLTCWTDPVYIPGLDLGGGQRSQPPRAGRRPDRRRSPTGCTFKRASVPFRGDPAWRRRANRRGDDPVRVHGADPAQVPIRVVAVLGDVDGARVVEEDLVGAIKPRGGCGAAVAEPGVFGPSHVVVIGAGHRPDRPRGLAVAGTGDAADTLADGEGGVTDADGSGLAGEGDAVQAASASTARFTARDRVLPGPRHGRQSVASRQGSSNERAKASPMSSRLGLYVCSSCVSGSPSSSALKTPGPVGR